MTEYLLQFVCGCLSGWTQVLTMQPLEIIKVRLTNQSLLNPTYGGIVDCAKKIYSSEGAMAFYKGTLSPLIGTGALVALDFGAYELIKKSFARHYYGDSIGQKDTRRQLPIDLVVLAGMITGFPSALVVAPTDHTRIKMQVLNNQLKYKGSLDVGMKIYRDFGIRGLFQGFYPTLLGEVLALGIYFGGYEMLIRSWDQQREGPPSKVSSFFAGGIAGCLSWLLTYPIDYIKTVIQSDDSYQRKYRTATQAAILKYRQEGLRTFFKGLGITMLRAFPVNAVGFVAYEYFRDILIKRQKF